MINIEERNFQHQSSVDSNGPESRSIKSYQEENFQLLNEKRKLYIALEEKNNEIIRLTSNHKHKWENMCKYVQAIENILNELTINDSRLEALRLPIDTLETNNYETRSVTSSSLNTNDTQDSNYTTSTESIIANNVQITLQNTPNTVETNTESLNSLSGCKSMEQSCVQYLDNSIDRPQSHCLMKTDSNMNKNSKLDSAISEPEFKIPEAPSPTGFKKIFKKNSLAWSRDKSSPYSSYSKIPSSSTTSIASEFIDINTGYLLSDYDNKEICGWLCDYVRLPKILIESIKHNDKLNQSITGSSLINLAMNQNISTRSSTNINSTINLDVKYDKFLGINDKVMRLKVSICLYLSNRQNQAMFNDKPNHLIHKDVNWISQVWLTRYLGLSHLSNNFLSRNIDGRLIYGYCQLPNNVQKELISLICTNFDKLNGLNSTPMISNTNTALSSSDITRTSDSITKFEMKSLKYGIVLLEKFQFDFTELDSRRVSCENTNDDLLVWTNERLSKWFHQMDLKQYTRGMEYSGLHGAVMVLDSEFTPNKFYKLIQVSPEALNKYSIEEKLSNLLKPGRFNEGIKTKRSSSIFQRRSFSQPRHVSNAKQSRDSKQQQQKPAPPTNTSPTKKTSTTVMVTTQKSPRSDLSSSRSTNKISTTPIASTSTQRHREKSSTLDNRTTSQTGKSNFTRQIRPIGMMNRPSNTNIEKEPSEISLVSSSSNHNSSVTNGNATVTTPTNTSRYVKSPQVLHSTNQMITKRKKQQKQSQHKQHTSSSVANQYSNTSDSDGGIEDDLL